MGVFRKTTAFAEQRDRSQTQTTASVAAVQCGEEARWMTKEEKATKHKVTPITRSSEPSIRHALQPGRRVQQVTPSLCSREIEGLGMRTTEP